MTELFILVIAFSSWDECWDYAHANKLTTAFEVCEGVMVPKQVPVGLAPDTSLRPVARELAYREFDKK